MRPFRIVPRLMLVLALVVSGCTGGDAPPPLYTALFAAGRTAIATRRSQKAPRPVITRALLDTIEESYLEVTIERRDQLAYLQIAAERRDDLPGRIVVWRTEDNITLALRNGILIATRGLGGDLVSTGTAVSGDRPGPTGGGEKTLMVRALDTKELRLTLACDLVDLGPVALVIVGRSHPTRHLRERCTGAGGTVTNDYWVDSRRQMVWQSRQWAGPSIGYLLIRRLTVAKSG